MTKLKTRGALALATCLVAATGLAACGSSSNDSTSTAAAASTTTPTSGGQGDTVDVADGGDLGQILVDGNGMTIYLFEKDTSGNASACTGECPTDWPPVTTKGQATAGSGIDASKLTTFKRDDGTTQVALNGHPLYTFSGDSSAGDTNGNGLNEFGGEWYAMTSAGDSVSEGAGSADDTGSSSSDTSTSSSSGGYSY